MDSQPLARMDGRFWRGAEKSEVFSASIFQFGKGGQERFCLCLIKSTRYNLTYSIIFRFLVHLHKVLEPISYIIAKCLGYHRIAK